MQPQGERERDCVGGILADLAPASDPSQAHSSVAALAAGSPAASSMPPSALASASAVATAAPAVPSNTSTNNNAVLQMNLDHYKYLRTLLPTIPHVIDSLSVSDANSWECTIYAALLTESDCLKWLMEFQDNTKTDWKAEVDHELLAATERHKQTGSGMVNYGKVYRCVGSAYQDAGGEELIRKKCPAKIEMKILNTTEVERKGKSKQYPCQVHISFYHNHTLSMTINGGLLSTSVCSATATAVAEFKVQQQLLDQATTSSTLKDQYEYFLPNNNIGDGMDHATAAVNLSAIQPPPPHHHSQLIQKNQDQQEQPQAQSQPLTVILPQQSHQTQLHPTTYQQEATPSTVVFDMEDVSKRLDGILVMLKLMLKKTGTSCAAVKQFADHFDSLKGDEDALETALCNFGRNAVASVASSAVGMTLTALEGSQVPLVPSVVTTAASSLMGQNEQLPGAIVSTPHWTMTPVLPQESQPIEGSDAVAAAQCKEEMADSGDAEGLAAESQAVGRVGVAVSDAVAKTLKKLKTNRRKPKSALSGVLPGMIDPVTGKRRKRSRCGTCLGCLNRDKTQDCRVCRNCIDQKRYGGPGRLKKACVKRSCIIMATQEGLEPIPAKAATKATPGSSSSTVSSESPPVQDQPLLDGAPIALPIHPVSVNAAPTDATTPVPTATLPRQPVTLAVRTTAASSQLAASAPRRTMAIPSTTTPTTTEMNSTPAAVLSWPNGTAFAPTFQVRKAVGWLR